MGYAVFDVTCYTSTSNETVDQARMCDCVSIDQHTCVARKEGFCAQVQRYMRDVSFLLRFQEDNDHGFVQDGLQSSDFPGIRCAGDTIRGGTQSIVYAQYMMHVVVFAL